MQHLATTKLQFASTPNELHVILCWHLNLKLYFPINFLVHPILHDKAACQTTKRLKIRWVFFDIVCASRSKHNFQNNRGKKGKAYPVRRATWRNIVVEFTRDSGRSEREWTFLCVDSGVALAKRRNEKFSIKAFIGVCDGFPFLCSFRSFGVLKQIITCIRVVHLSPFASFLFLHYPTLPDTPDGRDGRPIVVYMLRRL